MERTRKFDAVRDLADSLVASGTTMTFDDLARWLNQRGFQTSYGTPYQGGRGVARLVHAIFDYVRDELGLGEDGASRVAEAFTGCGGTFAYD